MLFRSIAVRFLEDMAGKRVGRHLDAFTAILVTVTMAAIANEFVAFSGKIRVGGQATFLLYMPTWPYWYVVTAIFCFAAVVQVLVMIIMIARLLDSTATDAGKTQGGGGTTL